jgi:hypothetical protein
VRPWIRERLPRATILTFWRIPWPHAEQFGICPWNRDLLERLLGNSIVGFHTQQHCDNFIDSVDRYMGASLNRTLAEAGVSKGAAYYYSEGSKVQTRAHPWAVAMARGSWLSIGDTRAARAVEPTFEWARGLLARLVDRGVEVGAVRGDVPRELLVDILVQLDGAVDRWMLGEIDQLPAERVEAVGATLLDMTRRVLAPPGDEQ